MLDDDARALLREGPIFEGASDASLDALCADAEHHRFAAGELVLREGEPSRHAYALLRGSVGIVYTNAEGMSIVVKVLDAPCVFGEMELFHDLPRQETVRPLDDIEVAAFGKSAFLRFLEIEPAACLQKLREMSAWLAISTHLERGLAFDPIETRLAGFLLYLCQRHSEETQGKTRIKLRLTYPQLAASLAVTERSIERTLGAWLKEAWLRRDRGHYVIDDLDALKQRADPDWLELLARLSA